MIPYLTLFPFIGTIRNHTLRRTVMVIVCPLVFVESHINATISFINSFRYMWNTGPEDIH